MLVTKNVLNEIKKSVHSLKVSRIEGGSKEHHIKIRENLLIKLTVQARAERVTSYEFPLSLNPVDKSNNAQT